MGFDPVSLAFDFGGAILGGIFGSNAEAEEERRQRQKVREAQALVRKGLVSDEELGSRLRDIDRLFNKRLISTLNSTAFGARRLANANVAGASVAGQLGAQAEATKVQYSTEVDRLNANIYTQLGYLEMQNYTPNYTSGFLESAIPGLFAANEFQRTLGFLNKGTGGGAGAGIGTGQSGTGGSGQNTGLTKRPLFQGLEEMP
jgi:hypothetical protein